VSWKPSNGKKLSTGLAVVLENVAAGFKYPNVLDVKLGARLWADDAPPSKRQKFDELANRTTTGTLGFRVAGMKIRHHHEEEEHDATHQKKEEEEEDPAHVQIKNGYKSYTKYYGQSFSQHTILDAFTTYLGGVHTDPRTGKKVFRRKRAGMIVQRFIRELESIQYVLENEESRMYSASVLMVYEGDDEALEVAIEQEQKEMEQEVPMDNEMVDGDDEDEDGEEDEDEDEDDDEVSPPKVHEVRLIDFAHASWTPGQGPDGNMLMGVKNILRILMDLVD
jgi:1D-myo-inositol-tetrakisphosphate 5-kinase/inositol-polyphosphate multikinase